MLLRRYWQMAGIICVTGLLSACTTQNNTGSVMPQESSSSLAMVHDAEPAAVAMNPQTREEKIANAMSAAPNSVSADATVLDWPATASGALSELRKGTNGWTCLPDNASSPGNDPICVDDSAMAWFQAYMTKQTPKLSQPGIGYMLQGGSDASNTDPFAEKPAPGEDWMNAPPHMMLFPAGNLDPDVYGTAMNGGPWIMWSGTPYEHLMIPVK